MMGTREALEKKIDENPLDPTPHLVIADWFDENDQPDEAAFRRAMGQWMQSRKYSPEGHHVNGAYGWRVDDDDAPPGVEPYPHESFVIHPRTNWMVDRGRTIPPHDPMRSWNGYQWRSYRGMEEAFRRAFINNLRRQRSQKMARRVRARRYSRKK